MIVEKLESQISIVMNIDGNKINQTCYMLYFIATEIVRIIFVYQFFIPNNLYFLCCTHSR